MLHPAVTANPNQPDISISPPRRWKIFFSVDTVRHDRNRRVEPGRIVCKQTIDGDDVIAETKQPVRLARKFQKAEPAVHRTAIWQEDRVVEVINDWHAGVTHPAFDKS